MNKTKIKLSIVLLTYNHEKYIAQALESILMQKVDFNYEVIVCEDCSTDKTRDIILQYANKFKNIKLCFNKKNHGAAFTWMMSPYNSSNTKYVALLEGDDYWTDPDKLQQQVDFLDKNDDFVGCGHNTELYYEKENRRVEMNADNLIKPVNELSDIIEGKFYSHTSSYVWRNIFKEGYPKEMFYNDVAWGDWLLSMLYAKNGKINYIYKIMSCYRITGTGLWSKLTEYQKQFNMLRFMDIYNRILSCEHKFTHLDQRCKGFLLNHKENISFYIKLKTWLLLAQHVERDKKSLENKINPKLSIICGFLFNALHLFDVNRYYVYYKGKFYRFFKIKIYKELPK